MTDSRSRDAAVGRLTFGEMPPEKGRSKASACPPDDLLAAYADEVLFPADRAAVESHLATCAQCRQRLPTIRAGRAGAREEPALLSPSPRRTHRKVAPLAALLLGALGLSMTVFVLLRDSPEPPAPTSADGASTSPAPAAPPASPEPPPRSALGITFPETAESEPSTPRPERPAVETPAAAAAAPSREAPPREVETRERPAPRPAPLLVTSADPGERWRIAGSRVEHSTDGGSMWTRQLVAQAALVTAGASPASSICWLVGREGAILLSTNGEDWRGVAFPEPADLVAVRAVDAERASVTASDGREWATTDGGRTWAAVNE